MTLPYSKPNPQKWHPDTKGILAQRYRDLRDIHSSSVFYAQIYNSLSEGTGLPELFAQIRLSERQLAKRLQGLPGNGEAWEIRQQLDLLAEFCENAQETSARLHNKEPKRQAAIEELNRLFAESARREEEQQQKWLAEQAAGDAYFGGPGSYQQFREAHYAETDLKKWKASGDRIRAFREAYHRGELPQPEPTQVSLWEVSA